MCIWFDSHTAYILLTFSFSIDVTCTVAAATIVTAVEGIIIKSIGDLPHLQSALLACRIEQNTTALKISWEFEGAPIDDMSSQFAGRTSIELSRLNASALVTVLHINKLSYRDSGVYTCKVEERTRTGRISASVTVTLQLQGLTKFEINVCMYMQVVCLFSMILVY